MPVNHGSKTALILKKNFIGNIIQELHGIMRNMDIPQHTMVIFLLQRRK